MTMGNVRRGLSTSPARKPEYSKPQVAHSSTLRYSGTSHSSAQAGRDRARQKKTKLEISHPAARGHGRVEEAMVLPLAVSTQACGSNRSLKKPAATKMTNGSSASAEKIWTHAHAHACRRQSSAAAKLIATSGTWCRAHLGEVAHGGDAQQVDDHAQEDVAQVDQIGLPPRQLNYTNHTAEASETCAVCVRACVRCGRLGGGRQVRGVPSVSM